MAAAVGHLYVMYSESAKVLKIGISCRIGNRLPQLRTEFKRRFGCTDGTFVYLKPYDNTHQMRQAERLYTIENCMNLDRIDGREWFHAEGAFSPWIKERPRAEIPKHIDFSEFTQHDWDFMNGLQHHSQRGSE